MGNMKIILFIIPAVLLAVGLISKFHPAKKINSVVGFRTAKSRSSQEKWDQAQQLMAKYYIIIGAAELVIAAAASALLNGLSKDQYLIFLIIMLSLQACGAVLVIPLVNREL